MVLIVGLGNIGEEYLYTRHNIGFHVIDALLSRLSPTPISNPNFQGKLYRDGDIFLLKPSTYMNLSGQSVTAVRNFFKLENIVIIHDDLDLPFGALRFKVGGGSGGHNGIKSLDNWTQQNSIRVRMGIGKPPSVDISKYVLSKFSSSEMECFDKWVELASSAILNLLQEDWQSTSSKFSKKSAKYFCPQYSE